MTTIRAGFFKVSPVSVRALIQIAIQATGGVKNRETIRVEQSHALPRSLQMAVASMEVLRYIT